MKKTFTVNWPRERKVDYILKKRRYIFYSHGNNFLNAITTLYDGKKATIMVVKGNKEYREELGLMPIAEVSIQVTTSYTRFMHASLRNSVIYFHLKLEKKLVPELKKYWVDQAEVRGRSDNELSLRNIRVEPLSIDTFDITEFKDPESNRGHLRYYSKLKVDGPWSQSDMIIYNDIKPFL